MVTLTLVVLLGGWLQEVYLIVKSEVRQILHLVILIHIATLMHLQEGALDTQKELFQILKLVRQVQSLHMGTMLAGLLVSWIQLVSPIVLPA